jgi:hypothetical protein
MSETRQRWRLIVRRGPGARGLGQREVESLWAEGLARAGVPVATTETARPRPRIAFAAPMPADALAEREPIDLFLAERLRIADLRPGCSTRCRRGTSSSTCSTSGLRTTLAARVVAADYRVAIPDAGGLADACVDLLASPRLERPRRRGRRSGVRPATSRRLTRRSSGSALTARPSNNSGCDCVTIRSWALGGRTTCWPRSKTSRATARRDRDHPRAAGARGRAGPANVIVQPKPLTAAVGRRTMRSPRVPPLQGGDASRGRPCPGPPQRLVDVGFSAPPSSRPIPT